MKKIFFIFLLLTIVSCSSVKYYEYYYNDNLSEINSKYVYSTLEVHKDKAIYRAFDNGYVYKEKEPVSFIYIETEKISDLDYIPLWKASKFYYYTDENQKKVIDYTLLSETDIKLLGGYFKENNVYRKENKKPEDYHFDNSNLNRISIEFPSELKRVKKIDYSKFPKTIKKINPENPDSQKDNIK
ncbi:hypothetical protein QWZ06_19675 [Chryseobacterium tructae]|uniref:DUF3997 domain-containing protein n=1 Tax=Chryseobacterium tructae TaxID=1037380 RepID=A0ABV7Y060_9FLAO|nr:hypothetical protein [Chryseobacterium tructae]MDN3694344.1 hypothetical protein [Chryseobacterium tructae]